MFTVEIKINGALIGHIYGLNQGEQSGMTKYHYEYYEPEQPKLSVGTVLHERDNGIRDLISLILADVKANGLIAKKKGKK